MAWVAVAVVGTSVISGISNANAAKSAASAQVDAADRAAQESSRQFELTRQDNMPWHDAGVGALGQMTAGLSPGSQFNRDFTMADFNNDPGLQFRMQQGRDAVEGSAAARGGLLSGGTLKALTNYGQEFGSQEYGKAYDRFNNNMTTRFNRLASVAGIGQTATRDTNQARMNTSESVNNTNMMGANASASGTMGASNGLTNGITNGINGYMSLNMLNKFTNPGVSAGVPAGVPASTPNAPMTYGPPTYGNIA